MLLCPASIDRVATTGDGMELKDFETGGGGGVRHPVN
jgi:hypothetical protein